MAEAKLTFNKIRRYFWPVSIWKRVLVIFLAIVFLFTATSYGVAQWYIARHNDEPLVLGTTFVPDYARSYGLDPKETLEAIFSELGMRQVRLVSYWKAIEPTPGTYDFSELDWQFALANKYDVQVCLAIGLRQPRWPECHEPAWVSFADKQWEPKLYQYMQAVVDRYKNNPALSTYELENEFFMSVFGECKDFNRDRLIYEYGLVKQWDPTHPVIVSRSNNWIGLPLGQPRPDKFGISVYKRVWDKTLTKRYFEYPLPAWFYAALAGGGELLSGKDMIIHELQAEPWPPTSIKEASVEEQFKSLNPSRLKDRIDYGIGTGMRTIDLWGAEWWYFVKIKKNDPSIWNVVKDAVVQAEIDNQKLVKN
ncbi:MAG: beta-galactosidase [Patescibacteria group bacterium]